MRSPQSLGLTHVGIAGHDIGLMVAYAYAAQYPDEVDRIALMDAFLPGIGDWNSVFLLRDLWHFHFFGPTPLALVTGRERIYLDHFWNDFAADPAHSVSEANREFYVKAYAQPGAMKAGMEVFRNFPQDAEDFAAFAETKLTMPMLVLSGEKAGGTFLIDAGEDGRRSRRGRHHQGLRPLADGRSAGSGHPEAGGILRELSGRRSIRAGTSLSPQR